jgi:SAM-dependent methyltransferase
MGIAKSAFQLLIEEAKKNNFTKKKILQLGRQFTFLTLAEAINCAKKANFPYQLPRSFNSKLKNCNYIDDITLFSLLGFNEIYSLDVSSFEQASLIHDLNTPVPIEWHHQYDVIFDGGTLEHIFNLPQVLKNIHNLLKEDGIIIHASPSHNHVDHGFYMFSPTLFSDYYSANSYKILTSYIFEYTFECNSPWKFF